MSLFKQLEKLYRPDRFQREDFLTEIVVQVLRDSQDLALDWLRSLGVTDLQKVEHIKIDSQVVFRKLPGHDTDSRPDMAITLVESGNTELILIESKVDSKQGNTQLKRYTDHLTAEKERKALQKISLIFITRDYEVASVVLDHSFNFKVTRWFEFYKKLSAHLKSNSDGLAKQLKLFMEENRMSLGNQFRSTDLVAMENFLSAKALMDETLQGEVSQKITKLLGSVSTITKASIQLRDQERYIVYPNFNGFECLIGYWFPHENPDEPVWVGIKLYSDPKASVRKEVIQAFRGWTKKTGDFWTGEQLDDETAWSCIYKGKAIHSLMGGEDHVRAIKNHLLELLEEVGQFKKTYPGLRWEVSTSDIETEK